jgi:transposase InsO family protein
MSRQAYYKEQKVREQTLVHTEHITEAVREIRREMPRIGTRKIKYILEDNDIQIGRDRLFSILKEQDMLIAQKKKFVRTTYRDESLPVFRNLYYQFEPSARNQAWVSDITYIRVNDRFMYLSLITDLFSRRVMGWNLSHSLDAEGAAQALHQAIGGIPKNAWPIHHSDRGSQYCCHEYVNILRARHLPISMTEANHCYENCYAERVNGILKGEFNLDAVFQTPAQALECVKQAITSYNSSRPHYSLDLQTPDQAHGLVSARPKLISTCRPPKPRSCSKKTRGRSKAPSPLTPSHK